MLIDLTAKIKNIQAKSNQQHQQCRKLNKQKDKIQIQKTNAIK